MRYPLTTFDWLLACERPIVPDNGAAARGHGRAAPGRAGAGPSGGRAAAPNCAARTGCDPAGAAPALRPGGEILRARDLRYRVYHGPCVLAGRAMHPVLPVRRAAAAAAGPDAPPAPGARHVGRRRGRIQIQILVYRCP